MKAAVEQPSIDFEKVLDILKRHDIKAICYSQGEEIRVDFSLDRETAKEQDQALRDDLAKEGVAPYYVCWTNDYDPWHRFSRFGYWFRESGEHPKYTAQEHIDLSIHRMKLQATASLFHSVAEMKALLEEFLTLLDPWEPVPAKVWETEGAKIFSAFYKQNQKTAEEIEKPKDNEMILSIPKAAKMLGLTSDAVRSWVNEGKLPHSVNHDYKPHSGKPKFTVLLRDLRKHVQGTKYEEILRMNENPI